MMDRPNDSFERLLMKFPQEYRTVIDLITGENAGLLEEIRIRAESNIILVGGFGEKDSGIYVSSKGIVLIIDKLLDHSIYAHMEDLCKGYVTAEGGHRVGICGRAVMENDKIKTIKEISSLNIRKSRAVTGCAGKIYKYLLDKKGIFLSTLIISPPKCGKTTLLRDIVKTVSDSGIRVSLVDERSEIAAMYRGIPQHDVGKRTDVLDGGKKSDGMSMMIRAMSPQVICTDEIGTHQDAVAIGEAVTAGIGVLTTVHGNNLEELRLSKIGQLIEDKVFSRYVFMSGNPKVGTVTAILDKEGKKIEF